MVFQEFLFQNTAIVSKSPKIHNVRNKPFKIYGLYHPWESGVFKRVPLEVAKKTSRGVERLCTNTAGARVRFKTDSPYIAVGAVYPPMEFLAPNSTALSATGAYCFDLYADGKFCDVLLPNVIEQRESIVNFVISGGKYESCYDFRETKFREITLNFPSFVDISDVYIGLKEDAVIEASNDYFHKKPVVFYGSSITNGACASRPGNTYENILSRRMNMDYLNLGFSGSAKAEKEIIDYIANLDMSVFVFDYDHNAPSPEFLEETHYPALERFRKLQPHTPIIMLSRPNQSTGLKDISHRLDVIRKSYEKMLAAGDENIYFINGQDIYNSYDSEAFTIDGVHPTDFGFYCIADAIEKVLKNIYSRTAAIEG